eukprot:9233369-Pyramimonas_sp.AAC.2
MELVVAESSLRNHDVHIPPDRWILVQNRIGSSFASHHSSEVYAHLSAIRDPLAVRVAGPRALRAPALHA